MATALFVFDHIFPVDSAGNCYYSSGFDEDFFKRYYSIFDRVDIFGRKRVKDALDAKNIVAFPSKFYLFNSNKIIAKAYKRIDEAILNNSCVIIRMPSIFGSLAIKRARKLGKPYIIEIVSCEYDALSTSKSYLRRMLARPAELFYRLILKNNPYSIYVTKTFLQSKYPSKGEQIAISNVTLPIVDESLLKKREKHYCSFNPQERLLLGTCSTLDVDFKGQEYVIRAIPDLVCAGLNVEYQLVGDGNGKWLTDIAKEIGVQKRVKLIGHLDHNQVFEWLDSIDIYVHPSCQEGLSRAIIEAMSRACPVVAADAGGVFELIDKDFVFPKRDSSAIVFCIKRILKNGLLDQATANITKSKEYRMDHLYKKREDFFHHFLKENDIQ